MPVVKFTQDFDWKPILAATTAYKAGMELLVTTACADRAVRLGKGVIVKKQRRKKSDGQDTVGG